MFCGTNQLPSPRSGLSARIISPDRTGSAVAHIGKNLLSALSAIFYPFFLTESVTGFIRRIVVIIISSFSGSRNTGRINQPFNLLVESVLFHLLAIIAHTANTDITFLFAEYINHKHSGMKRNLFIAMLGLFSAGFAESDLFRFYLPDGYIGEI
jgi:hypothetical protein